MINNRAIYQRYLRFVFFGRLSVVSIPADSALSVAGIVYVGCRPQAASEQLTRTLRKSFEKYYNMVGGILDVEYGESQPK